MRTKLRSSMTYANVMATFAVFVALGGTSYAVATGSIDSREIKNNSVRSKDVRNSSLLSKDFKPGQLPVGAQGPRGDIGPPGLSGVEQIPAQTASNSESPKRVTATCSAGKRVIGTGAEIVGGGSGSSPDALANVVIQKVVPGDEAGTGDVFVEAMEEEATALNWSVVAFAICATTP